MTWYAPFTFVAGVPITAEDLNKYLYDNMQETLIGKLKSGAVSSTEGVWFSSDGVNSVVGRQIVADTSVGSGFRASTTYGVPTINNGGHVNPTVTVQTGTKALVVWSALTRVNTASQPAATTSCYTGVAVSGASSISANDTYAIRVSGSQYAPNDENTWVGTVNFDCMAFRWFTGLTPGTNTFTLHYRCNVSGIQVRTDVPSLVVIPFE